MSSGNCVFCSIVAKKEPSEVVLDLENYLVIKNKYPKAPIHLLVLDKQHHEKSDTIAGVYKSSGFWDEMFTAANAAISTQNELKNGKYEIVLNGSGYAHFQHEHLHILGGYVDGQSTRT